VWEWWGFDGLGGMSALNLLSYQRYAPWLGAFDLLSVILFLVSVTDPHGRLVVFMLQYSIFRSAWLLVLSVILFLKNISGIAWLGILHAFGWFVFGMLITACFLMGSKGQHHGL
jgi:hypothetical protein